MERSTGDTPRALKERPILLGRGQQYYETFQLLRRAGTMGYSGENPIAVSEIKAYLDIREELNVEERVRVLNLVRGLDCVYLAHGAEGSK